MTRIETRRATRDDEPAIFDIYRRVAAQGGGLLRRADEITHDYIRFNLQNSLAHGLSILAVDDKGDGLGELHGWTSQTRQLRHVFTNLTVAVDPRAQGRGAGRALFQGLIAALRADMPHVRIIELYCREDNVRAIALYASLGFVQEGRLKHRVWQEDGLCLDDLIMALDLTTL
ncbi:MAG: N-acetyltransferase [Asticcacaulis sp.]